MHPARAPSRLAPWMSSTNDVLPRRVQSPGAKSYKDWLTVERVGSVEREDVQAGQGEAAQEFRKWLRSSPEDGRSDEDTLAVMQAAVRKRVIDRDIKSPDTVASDEMYRCLAELSSTPEATVRAYEGTDHQHLRTQLLDEKAKRESFERQVGVLRLQVAKCDRAVERAVDRAVKQTIEVHEEAFRKSRELLQQQLVAADNERESALAKADDLARELSALSATVGSSVGDKDSLLATARQESHELRQCLQENKAILYGLKLEKNSAFERLHVEEMKCEQVEVHAASLERQLQDLMETSFDNGEFANHALAGQLSGAKERQVSELAHREMVLAEDKTSRELQGYKLQIENLEAELAEARAQVAAQHELLWDFEARERATTSGRDGSEAGIMEQLQAAKAELTVTRDAAIQVVTLKAELAALKVRTAAEMEAQRMASAKERKRYMENIRHLNEELAQRCQKIKNSQVSQGADASERMDREQETRRGHTSSAEKGEPIQGSQEREHLEHKLDEAMVQIRALEEEAAFLEGKVAAEVAARASLEIDLAEQKRITIQMEERLRPLHEEYLQCVDVKGEMFEQLSVCKAHNIMVENRVSAEIGMRTELEEMLKAVQHQGGPSSYKEVALLHECRSMAAENEIQQHRKVIHRAELEHLQRLVVDLRERLRMSESLVSDLREGQNLSASSISMEIPSLVSQDLVGAAGLVGNLNESTLCVGNGLDIEPSASTIDGAINQMDETMPCILSSSSSVPQAISAADQVFMMANYGTISSCAVDSSRQIPLPQGYPISAYPSSLVPTPNSSYIIDAGLS